MDLGSRIANLRQKRGLNQSELARRLGLKPQAVQAWENGGGIRPGKYEAIADALNVSLAELLLGDEYRPFSQSGRPDPDTLRDAMAFLDELDGIMGNPVALRPDPLRLAIAIEVVTEGGVVEGKSVIVRLADRLREGELRRGNESGAVAGVG